MNITISYNSIALRITGVELNDNSINFIVHG